MLVIDGDCPVQAPAISVTNEALYTPRDEEHGLAGVGEPVEFTMWTRNAGNVDIHNVEVSEDGESNLSCVCVHNHPSTPSSAAFVLQDQILRGFRLFQQTKCW